MARDPRLARRTPAPQLALRITAFGLVAFGVFAVLFLRLWFLQVLQNDQYLAKAQANRERVVRIAAPRGTIVDHDYRGSGRALVENRIATVVTLAADAIPEEDVNAIRDWGQRRGKHDADVDALADRLARAAAVRDRARRRRATQARIAARRTTADATAARRLRADRPRDLTLTRDASPELRRVLRDVAPVLHVRASRLYERVVSSVVRLPYAGVPLKARGVTAAVRNYLLERPGRFPGVTVTKEYARRYPGGQIAAQIYGSVSQITPEQLKDPKYRGLEQGQRIGQDGLEYEYDSYLRGRDGERRIQVDAQGQPTGEVTEVPPVPGDRLRLTLDSGLSRAGQEALRRRIGTRIDAKTQKRAGGAFVAIDPSDGGIRAMGSYPSLNPGVLEGITTQRYKRLTSARNGGPLTNRAITAAYPAASTFKLATATAGLASGTIGVNTAQGDGACFVRPGLEACNAGHAIFGATNVTKALTVSSDTFFYQLGWDLYPKENQPLQRWARLLGFGRRTGIDLPGEAPGVIPDEAWRRGRDREEQECRKQRKTPSCGLVAQIGAPFTRGDEVNASIGQGDVQITPLQLATAYGGFFDPGGQLREDLHVPVPHVAEQIENAEGVLEESFNGRNPPRRVQLPAEFKRAIKQGLHGATSEPGGTATRVFAGWPQAEHPVLGKTGTAERCSRSSGRSCPEQSWFVGMVEDRRRPIVIAATVEDGGAGADAGAPIVCELLRRWYGVSKKRVPCAAPSGPAPGGD
ncbi:penicillin-binding transpeptidase domain-containing protein [Patulibacter sp. SYSU D01012]|uniref:penicillin-binding transpeptidase domain-containing protein n=1 Tax=Patulibacter sp. SYSU D01012 TaxID=2817381 RepID=UPI001B30E400|nr:penicillin-binding transpeptidase domain-containing protein [Patulibacter sp. SYSU D01012]